MLPSKEFRELSETKRRILVTRIRAFINAGYTKDQIIKRLKNIPKGLVVETIQIVKRLDICNNNKSV